MATTQLFIPERIKVGFQNRKDTYTEKLAYVIYYDKKGVLRKEKSWQSWRDKKIPAVEFENVPTDGFVLNKGVGGQRHSYGWNSRLLPPGSPYIARCLVTKRPSGARETVTKPFRVGEEGRWAKDRLKNFLKISSW